MWNCQGTGNSLIVSQLEEMKKLQSPKVMVLIETKNKETYMERVRKKLRYDKMKVIESIGKAGGLTAFSDDEEGIKQVLVTAFTLEILIEDKIKNMQWWCIAIYASTDCKIRKEQWKVISRRRSLWGNNVIILGDLK